MNRAEGKNGDWDERDDSGDAGPVDRVFVGNGDGGVAGKLLGQRTSFVSTGKDEDLCCDTAPRYELGEIIFERCIFGRLSIGTLCGRIDIDHWSGHDSELVAVCEWVYYLMMKDGRHLLEHLVCIVEVHRCKEVILPMLPRRS